MLARFLCAAALLACAGAACAHRPSVQECREAGEFIRNAALSRDAGVTREAFISRLQGDLIAIRNYSPALRWFAQDEDDEAFLVTAVEGVFDRPASSVEHETDLLRSCLARMEAGTT